MTNMEDFNFKYCRVCLSSDTRLVSSLNEDFVSLLKMLLETKIFDGPCLFCYRCAHTMKKLFYFRDVCNRANNVLRESYVKNNKKKLIVNKQFERLSVYSQNLSHCYQTCIFINDNLECKYEGCVILTSHDDDKSVDSSYYESADVNSPRIKEETEEAVEFDDATKCQGDKQESSDEIKLECVEEKSDILDESNNIHSVPNKTIKGRGVRKHNKFRSFSQLSNKAETTTKSHLSCEKCNKTFKYPSLLKKHMYVHSGVRSFGCDVCDKTFFRLNDLRKHTFIVHSGEKMFICEVCGISFASRGNLNTHTLNHSGEKNHKCTQCDRAFVHAVELRRHFLMHTGERKHACDVCGRTFALKGNLTAHCRVHTGAKPYTCVVCGKSYSEAGSLKKHKRIHSGERPYECKVCGCKFTSSCGLKTHSMIHTGEKPHGCQLCSYRSSRSTHLKRHMLTHDKKKEK